jgi:hypothetical protein
MLYARCYTARIDKSRMTIKDAGDIIHHIHVRVHILPRLHLLYLCSTRTLHCNRRNIRPLFLRLQFLLRVLPGPVDNSKRPVQEVGKVFQVNDPKWCQIVHLSTSLQKFEHVDFAALESRREMKICNTIAISGSIVQMTRAHTLSWTRHLRSQSCALRCPKQHCNCHFLNVVSRLET